MESIRKDVKRFILLTHSLNCPFDLVRPCKSMVRPCKSIDGPWIFKVACLCNPPLGIWTCPLLPTRQTIVKHHHYQAVQNTALWPWPPSICTLLLKQFSIDYLQSFEILKTFNIILVILWWFYACVKNILIVSSPSPPFNSFQSQTPCPQFWFFF